MRTKDSFTHPMLEIAASCYSISSGQLRYLGGSQNMVYEVQQDRHDRILRITPGSNRSKKLILGELDWILFLANEGVSVSTPLLSRNGELVEVIEQRDGSYSCVCFEKARGRTISYPECLQDHLLYEKLGQLTGKLHALSKNYQPQDPQNQRQDWSGNWFLQNMDLIPPSFDFDEAEYSWFAEDIAVQLYYLVYVYGGEEGKDSREDQARRFMAHFMKGYTRENTLEDYWMAQIPLFLMLREMIVYIGVFRNYDGDESFSSLNNQWLKDWIAESKQRIEQSIPIVDIWNRGENTKWN
ncbi:MULTISPECIES: phosphotransferase enzyme family protein [Paenibacillus]|uniref:Aminoglycoside phosphotransferase domain-containing protein n=1 Tax=Paenibacillus borealis TaxID=160799 RepID=A0ABX3HGJ0_PAEBO|nr:phosphotransferase [Paenibacillus borealis]OMD49108.1 hypothetical protein BSK56_09775 [Paenibacillus borealis]